MQQPRQIPLAQLMPSKTNPRKHFDEAKLRDLATNISQHGFLQALLVRPVWCEGCHSSVQIAARKELAGESAGEIYEIVDGERRYRAVRGSELELITLPCDIRELTDAQVISIQLITAIHKEQLTPLEEAHGFRDLLKLCGENNAKLHTRESIAKSVGRDQEYVNTRLKLLRLPEIAIAALDSGRIGVRLATLIARVPDKNDREKAAAALISPQRLGGEPMSTREGETFIRENFMIELKGAPFDSADGTLPGPEEGKPLACASCEFRTGNNPELYGDVKRGDICTKPACYRKKCSIVFERLSAKVVGDDKSAKVFDGDPSQVFSAHDGVSLPYDSQFVDFYEKPAETFVSSAVDRTKLPTWEKLTAGRDVPKLLAADRAGRMRTLVKRDLALAAAKENGEGGMFVSGLGGAGRPAASAGESAARKKVEAEQRRQLAIACAASAALRAAICKGGLNKDALRTLLDLVILAVGADGVWFALKSLDVKKGANQTSEQAYQKATEKVFNSHELMALLVELLYARQLRINGVRKCEAFAALADLHGIDLKKIETTAIAEMKVRKGDETVDPKTLAQWVKARANQMSDAQIAKSWGVPVADVTGALGAVQAKRSAAKASKNGATTAEASFRKRGTVKKGAAR